MTIVKACACCGQSYTLAAWKELPLVGHADYGDGMMSFRNCTCRSTLVIRASESTPPPPSRQE
jgi:hypothetical protein